MSEKATRAERRLIRQWEQSLIDDYADYRAHQLLDPLYEQLQQWKDHRLSADEVYEAIHQVHKDNQERFKFFHQKQEELVRWIQFDPWFDPWLEQHPAPLHADLVPPELKSERSDDEDLESSTYKGE